MPKIQLVLSRNMVTGLESLVGLIGHVIFYLTTYTVFVGLCALTGHRLLFKEASTR